MGEQVKRVGGENRNKKLDGSFAVFLPTRSQDGKIVGTAEIRGVNNEVVIKTGYGIQDSTVEVRIYTIPKMIKYIHPADPFEIAFDSVVTGTTILGVVLNVRWEPPMDSDDEWAFVIRGILKSCWSLRRSVVASIKFDSLRDYHYILQRAIAVAYAKSDRASQPVILKGGKNDGIYRYSNFFSDGKLSLAEIIEDHANDNHMEWFCDPFYNMISIGNPAKTQDITEIPGKTRILNRRKFFRIGRLIFCSFLFTGNYTIQAGRSMEIDGKRWKIIRATYAERGDGNSESTGIALGNKFICDSGVNSWLAGRELDERAPSKKTSSFRIGDVVVPVDKDGNALDKYEELSGLAWMKSPDSVLYKDPRNIDFSDRGIMPGLIMGSPFAGNGVGLKFPVKDLSRVLAMTPHELGVNPVISCMLWKYDDIVPECEPEDLYLRLDDGYIYFNKENKTWLVKSEVIKLEASTPEVPETKPDPTTTTGQWIKISKGGSIELHFGTNDYILVDDDEVHVKSGVEVVIDAPSIKLGSMASLNLALADHTHYISVPIVGPVGTTPADCGASNSNTSKTKGE